MALLSDGLAREWQQKLPLVEGKRVVSVYFGGGTPALWGAKRIAAVMHSLTPHLSADCEVTLEANPEDVSTPLFDAYRIAGINRVSLGIQSFDAQQLDVLQRLHSPGRGPEAVDAIRAAGIDNISIDLMYDLPEQTVQAWEATLDQAIALPITHISLYNLQIEERTSFAKQRAEIEARMPDEDSSAEMLERACARFTEAGFERYEISAFARDGLRSRHNVGYWTGRPFLGPWPLCVQLLERGSVTATSLTLIGYVRGLEDGTAEDFREKLEPRAAERERLMIGLRLLDGVEHARVPQDEELALLLDDFIAQGLLERTATHLKLTARGANFHDHIGRELL